MYVKLSPGDLNPSPYPLYPTSTYTCRVTTAPRVRSGGKREVMVGSSGEKWEIGR